MKSLLVYVRVRAAQGNWICSEERKRLKRGDLFENKHPRQGSTFSSRIKSFSSAGWVNICLLLSVMEGMGFSVALQSRCGTLMLCVFPLQILLSAVPGALGCSGLG